MDLDMLNNFFILTSTTDVDCVNRQWLQGIDLCTCRVPLYSLHSATHHWVVEHAVSFLTSDWKTGCFNSSCPLSVLIHLEWAPLNREHSPQTCLPVVTCIWLDLSHFYIWYGSKLVCSAHVHDIIDFNMWIWIRLTTSSFWLPQLMWNV